jgi:hypothetical protein
MRFSKFPIAAVIIAISLQKNVFALNLKARTRRTARTIAAYCLGGKPICLIAR